VTIPGGSVGGEEDPSWSTFLSYLRARLEDNAGESIRFGEEIASADANVEPRRGSPLISSHLSGQKEKLPNGYLEVADSAKK
jgi:hypothetical protein